MFFGELLDDFSDVKGMSRSGFQRRRLVRLPGCDHVGDRLTEPAMRALFENLMIFMKSHVCPHGRPTMIRFSKQNSIFKIRANWLNRHSGTGGAHSGR